MSIHAPILPDYFRLFDVHVQIAAGQKVSKLDEKQTADMIKITCQRPDIRQGAIHQQFSNIHSAYSSIHVLSLYRQMT